MYGLKCLGTFLQYLRRVRTRSRTHYHATKQIASTPYSFSQACQLDDLGVVNEDVDIGAQSLDVVPLNGN